MDSIIEHGRLSSVLHTLEVALVRLASEQKDSVFKSTLNLTKSCMGLFLCEAHLNEMVFTLLD